MLTELDIIRAMMAANGEGAATSPTLETTHPSVLHAKAAVERWNKDFQSRGWWFNRERNIKLLPDADGFVSIPANTLSFMVTVNDQATKNTYDREQYVTRGIRVYDNLNHTYVISSAIYADLILLLPVDQLPGTAASYLQALSVQQFYEDDDGDLNKASKLEDRKTEAWHRLYSEELKSTAQNALSSPAAIQLRYRIFQQNAPSSPMLPGGR